MAETGLAFSKIVATPTPSSWSQAYSAGKLFSVMSLETETVPENEQGNLSEVGKDLISTLEAEFFTLESKNLDSIKQAIEATVSRVREGIKLSFVLCYLSDNVLYLYSIGGAKAILKRGDKVGSIIEASDTGEIKTASGYVQEDDLLILETKAFQKIIPTSTLASSLDHNTPENIAESLAPNVHEREEGGASALILRYKQSNGAVEPIPPITEPVEEPKSMEEELASEESETIPDENPEDVGIPEPAAPPIQEPTPPGPVAIPSEPLNPELISRKKVNIPFNFKNLRIPALPLNLSHQRRLILTVGVIIVFLIITTSALAIRNRTSNQNEELFAEVYNEAKSKYDEGVSLKDLNAELSRESFVQAKDLLEENKDKFSEGSDEQAQVLSLLASINRELGGGGGSQEEPETEAKEVSRNESSLLSYVINNSRANHFTQNADAVFFLDGTGVSRITKSNDQKQQVIDKSWGEDGGIGLFGSNVYVLDKDDGILKFVPSGSSYTESNYFTGDAPDLSSSVSMAIDGSIYVLFQNGTLRKYTRGAQDTFTVSGVNGGFSSPTKVFTSEDSTNIYVLDNGNSRIVILGKNGSFKSALSSNLLKGAKEFDVNEAESKIYFLSGGKVYELPL